MPFFKRLLVIILEVESNAACALMREPQAMAFGACTNPPSQFMRSLLRATHACSHTHTQRDTYIRTYIHIHIDTHIHIHIHTQHTYTHTHTFTYTHVTGLSSVASCFPFRAASLRRPVAASLRESATARPGTWLPFSAWKSAGAAVSPAQPRGGCWPPANGMGVDGCACGSV